MLRRLQQPPPRHQIIAHRLQIPLSALGVLLGVVLLAIGKSLSGVVLLGLGAFSAAVAVWKLRQARRLYGDQ